MRKKTVSRAVCSTRLCFQVNELSVSKQSHLTSADSFDSVQERYPDLVAIDSSGDMTGNVADFCKSSVQHIANPY